MAKIECSFAELHSPLFLAGTSLPTKLDPETKRGLILIYDTDEKELHVTWKGITGHLPSTSIHVYVPGEPEKKVEQKTHPVIANIQSAQVETPMGHVHKGPGFGQTGVGGRIK